jgi:probable rRNA maturation factor
MSVDINNESGAPIDETALVGLARHVMDELGIHPQAELSLMLVGVDAMSALHEQWMDEPGPTDVLAFPQDELRPGRGDKEPLPGMLGDVVLCPAVAATQAAEHNRSTESELHLLCTHGILHLLGYDHADPDEKREMFALQESLLAGWERIASASTASRASAGSSRIRLAGGDGST